MGRHGAGRSQTFWKISPFVAFPLMALLLLTSIASMAPAEGPALQLSSHHDGQTVHSKDITLTGTASSPAGIGPVNVSLNAGPWVLAAGNESWSITLRLLEGANIIIINATDLEGNTTQQSIVIAYTITTRDSSGVVLAIAVVVVMMVLMVMVAWRLKPAPPPPENGAGEDVEARLERIRGKGEGKAGKDTDAAEEAAEGTKEQGK